MLARQGATRCFRVEFPISLLALRSTLLGSVLPGEAPAVRVRRGEAVRLRDLLPSLHQGGHHADAPKEKGPPLGALLQGSDEPVPRRAGGGYGTEGIRQ